jgi:hypothetical protein
VQKPFLHLQIRLEDLLSDVDGLDRRSHHEELLDELAADRRALATPKQVTLRIQKKTSAQGTETSDESESMLSVWDKAGKHIAEVRLQVKHLATLLVLWDRLWQPGEQKRVPHTSLQTEDADEEREAVYQAFSRINFRPWNPKDSFYTKGDNEYDSEYANSTSPLKKQVLEEKPVLKRYFLNDSVRAATLPDDLRKKYPVYAFPRPLPKDIKLNIEVVPDEHEQLLQLKENWPFDNLPQPEVVDD